MMISQQRYQPYRRPLLPKDPLATAPLPISYQHFKAHAKILRLSEFEKSGYIKAESLRAYAAQSRSSILACQIMDFARVFSIKELKITPCIEICQQENCDPIKILVKFYKILPYNQQKTSFISFFRDYFLCLTEEQSKKLKEIISQACADDELIVDENDIIIRNDNNDVTIGYKFYFYIRAFSVTKFHDHEIQMCGNRKDNPPFFVIEDDQDIQIETNKKSYTILKGKYPLGTMIFCGSAAKFFRDIFLDHHHPNYQTLVSQIIALHTSQLSPLDIARPPSPAKLVPATLFSPPPLSPLSPPGLPLEPLEVSGHLLKPEI